MVYIVGIVIFLIVIGSLGKLLGKLFELILGLAFLAGILFALITFGPMILAGAIAILVVIWPFLLFGFLGLLALGILISGFEKFTITFKTYPCN